jgi:exodeoxyribonuclease V alpha subunit
MKITAKISGIQFQNRNTGFYVLKAKAEGSPKQITIRGTFPGVSVSTGLKAKFTGGYEVHQKFGKQFHATDCEVIPEKGRNGIITYLTANVPSIGMITATRLYDALGDELVNVLNTDPSQVLELSFLTKTQSEAIIREWTEASESRTAAIFLTDIGLNASQVKSVFKKFGVKTKEVVNGNPYKLCECHSVGFSTADNAARKLGIGVDDAKRVRAMILFAMRELTMSDGHMYSTSDQILRYISNKMFKRHAIAAFSHGEYTSDSHFSSNLKSLQDSNDVVSFCDYIYLTQNWVHESMSADYISNIIDQPPREMGDLKEILSDFEESRDITLSDEQRDAFLLLDRSRFCVISGYPGTGKTTLVSAFVNLFEKASLHYVLLSPTGIAAKRLSQVTGKPAFTIHRALGYKQDGGWEFHAGNRYHVDAVIVDEMSMVDGAVLYHLISALPPTTIVIMVGDSAQLPSVGAGYVLNNLMQCQQVPHVSLTRVYRQEKQSDIITVAHSILKGEPVSTRTNTSSQFVYMNFALDSVMDEACKMSTALKSKECNFQVIAPMYDGELGVDNLNKRLREVLNEEFKSGKATKLKHGNVDLYEGDRVMVVRNDYDRMIFNGDVGKVTRVSIKQDEVEVKIFDWFDQDSAVPRYVDKVFIFKIDGARHMLKVSYACTAHKCQGQEFDYILMPMTMQYGIMLYRNLIYTAITRAKKKVFVFGDPKAFSFAIYNERETVRNSNLGDFIRNNLDERNPEKLEAISSQAS